jgi:hypothetical protein
VTDYDHYNTTGRVTRDTSDWSHIPEHIRITQHPEKIRNPGKPTLPRGYTELSEKDIAGIIALHKAGKAWSTIRRRYHLSEQRVKRIIETGDATPLARAS